MEQYKVTGMSCAACSARVEKAVRAVPGVTECAVNLLTNSMVVEGCASEEEIIRAVCEAGYGANKKERQDSGEGSLANPAQDELSDTETPLIRKRLIASLCFLVPLLYESMGHMLWNWPLPGFLEGNHLGMGLYELLLTGVIMFINRKFFINGWKGLIHRSPNMDTLVALGAGAAFGYSLVSLFAMTMAASRGDFDAVSGYMMGFYFESAATILTLITVGKMLEARSKGRTTDALRSLMRLSPKTAVLLVDGEETEVAISRIRIGDRFVVRAGASIPVDGVVVEGSGSVDQAALTGESIPVDKKSGDDVFAATINQSGHLICEASRVGEDTTFSQIIRMVSDAAATKAPIAKIADKVSGIFVPLVILIAAITFVIWLLAGQSVGFSLEKAIAVLVISCPCALGLATPVAIMVGSGMGAKNGILFKTASSLEETGRIQVIALDKTGTITKGEPVVKRLLPSGEADETLLLSLAYALEQKSEHPLAKAIVSEARKRKLNVEGAQDFEVKVGNGLTGVVDGKRVFGGNLSFVGSRVVIPDEMQREADSLSERGLTPVFFGREHQFLGIIAVADMIKEDSAEAILQMKQMGIRVVMVTGDNSRTAKAIGEEAGVDEIVAGVLPEGKEEVIRKLQKTGRVAMVGDGINDAPALTRADIGVAIGAGTDVAIDAADVVLMKNSLSDVAAAIRLSRATLRIIHENLFWAFIYNIIGIPLAAGVWYPIFGWTLNPMFGAAAMGLSSFCVVSNALRLNFFSIRNVSQKKEAKKIRKEKDGKMEIRVKGMMCGHCEAHVKKAIEAIDGVTEAAADYKTGVVTIQTSGEVDCSLIRAAVEAEGYEVL